MGAREQKLVELASGYDAYMELTSNLTEGTKVSQSNGSENCSRILECTMRVKEGICVHACCDIYGGRMAYIVAWLY